MIEFTRINEKTGEKFRWLVEGQTICGAAEYKPTGETILFLEGSRRRFRWKKKYVIVAENFDDVKNKLQQKNAR